MLAWPRYGAAARGSGESDDARAVEGVDALAFAAESAYGSRQLPEITGAMPLARRKAARARVMQELVTLWKILWRWRR
jgi:hypothetical protein